MWKPTNFQENTQFTLTANMQDIGYAILLLLLSQKKNTKQIDEHFNFSSDGSQGPTPFAYLHCSQNIRVQIVK